MILIFLTSLFMAGANARAEEFDNLPADVTYEQTTESLNKTYPVVLDKHFSDLNFEVLEGRHDISPSTPLAWMNKIYVTKKYGKGDARVVFAKSSVNLNGSVEFNKIYKHPKGYVVHYKVDDSNIVLFFRDFPSESIKDYNSEILRKLKQNVGKKSTASNSQRMDQLKNIMKGFFISAAFAETTEGASIICSKLANGETPKTETSALKQMWGCTKGFEAGAWDATGGAVWFAAKGAYNITVHPVETFNKVSDGFNSVVAAMKDFEGAFGEAKSVFQQLPNDIKWKIGCEVFSSLGTGAAIAFLTAGSGSPILLRAITQALLKIARVMPKSANSARLLKIAAVMGKKAEQSEAKVAELKKVKSGKDLSAASEKYLAAHRIAEAAQKDVDNIKLTSAASFHVANPVEVKAAFKTIGKKVVTFVGYSASEYEDKSKMLFEARNILSRLNPKTTLINIGATPEGIGDVYRVAKEMGFETAGIVSSQAKKYGRVSAYVDHVFYVEDPSWGGFIPGTKDLAPTSKAMVGVSDEIVGIGGGEVGRDEMLAAREAGKSVTFVPADMNHAIALKNGASKNRVTASGSTTNELSITHDTFPVTNGTLADLIDKKNKADKAVKETALALQQAHTRAEQIKDIKIVSGGKIRVGSYFAAAGCNTLSGLSNKFNPDASGATK